RLLLADADANRGDALTQRVARGVGQLLDRADGVDEGDERAGNAGGAGAAVGLQHVAVDGDGAGAEGFEVGDGAETAPDEALNFAGATVDLAGPLARLAGAGAAGQHAV